MSDSSIMTNMSFPSDAVQNETPAEKRKRKDRWFRKKMQFVRRKGLQEGRSIHNHLMGQAGLVLPRQNGAVTQCPRLLTSTPGTSSPGSLAGCPKPSTSMPSQTKAGTQCPSSSQKPGATPTSTGIPSKLLAIDCEMVGTGPKGRISHLARCSVVSHEGDVVYDKFIKPSVPVTDYRTRWSGIRHRDLVDATPYSEARKEILKLLMGKVVVGHAIHNDFKALGYTHPAALTRDTSRIPLLNAKAGFAKEEVASLKRLTKALFNRDIQSGRKGHSSVEDARATMQLYRVVEADWERELASRSQAS